MRVVALCSGGKDSTFAIYKALREGHELVGLVALVPARPDSMMFHWPNVELIGIFAEALGVPLIRSATSGEPERELDDLVRTLSKVDADGVVSGAVASQYQKSRIDSVCRRLGLQSLAPLWGLPPEEVLEAEVDAGFEILITAVAAEGLDARWLGKTLARQSLGGFLETCRRFRINPVGEGGEFETLVLDGPIFKKKIRVVRAEKRWMGTRGYYLIERAELEDKP
jgi:predicted ATP pyrophosphatase (TIGR00289 family)